MQAGFVLPGLFILSSLRIGVVFAGVFILLSNLSLTVETIF